MPVSSRVAHHRASIGNASLRGDQRAADEHRRDMRAVLLEEHVARVDAVAPPLTAEQRQTIAALLAGGGNDVT